MAKKKTIELTDDLRQEEPLAFLVYLHDTTVHEYKTFYSRVAAIDCATEQMNESQEDWPIYPLYAAKGEYVRG